MPRKIQWSFVILAVTALSIFFLARSENRSNHALLRGPLTVEDPALQQDQHGFPVGNFQIQWIATGQEHAGGYQGPRLVVIHQDNPGRWLWHTHRGEAFVGAAQGQETVTENKGSYWINDRMSRQCLTQSIEGIEPQGESLMVRGSLSCEGSGATGYRLIFTSVSDNQLGFRLEFDDPALNRAFLTYASDPQEHFYGFGEQFTNFDHKGELVPVWISEQGIGRGAQPVTALVNLAAKAGGHSYTTYAAAPHYITSQLRSLFLENSQYAEIDLRHEDYVQIHVFSGEMSGRILYGQAPSDLIFEYTTWAGRMRPLPDWILSGAVIGMQGGTQRVQEVYDRLAASGTPVAAFWLQDWVGQRITSFGKQLWWNWELDEDRYPDWQELRQTLAEDDVRLMVYASPFLADVSEKTNVRRHLFEEARQAGYLVKRGDGSPYLVQNTDFSAGMVDLTNPAAWRWYQTVLEEQVIQGAGASGWMADFGEALPYDAVLYNGAKGADFHNRYPSAWAQLNRELVDSQADGDDLVFFMRAASPQSPSYATLFWQGDQLVTWDRHDGLASAVNSLIGGGMSGLSLNHSDIGGYTTIDNPVLRVHRSKELLLRWMDFAAFTTVYRTHEGNIPDKNIQFYSDEETLAHFSRMAQVYAAWQPLRQKLVQEASQTGMPVARALFLHYPNDPITYTLSSEYLLGTDLLVAPVVKPDTARSKVYLPAGEWVHLWTGVVYRYPFSGAWITVDSPVGQPPVFYRDGSIDGMNLRIAVENQELSLSPP